MTATATAEIKGLPESTLTKHQEKIFRKKVGDVTYVINVRHDDNCGNGHNTFSITHETWSRRRRDPDRFGCIGDEISKEIAEVFPELAHLIKWHLCSTDGPTHYLANTLYLAGDKDCFGLRKGEKRQIKNVRTGNPVWKLVTIGGKPCRVDGIERLVSSPDRPESPGEGLQYIPAYREGEGKEPDLEGARRVAIWPEASLEDLRDREKLEARLPALMEEFKRDVESLGLVY